MNFLLKFREMHGDKFDYSNISNKVDGKVEIICKEHGSFFQNPYKHILGRGCPECKKKKKIESTNFIKRSEGLHNSRYDYSKSEYRGLKIPVKIICKYHGEFIQMPYLHLRGRGCAKCAIIKNLKRSEERRITIDQFINRCNIIHKNKYDYSLVNFKITRDKVDIICKKHGIFNQNVNSHLMGIGCPVCNSSKGEKLIVNILNENNIDFEREYKFDGCRVLHKLQFDFYLPNYNICIEYDGIQHYIPIDFFGGYESMIKLQKYDKIKTDFCEKNKIKLIRFKYTDSMTYINDIIKNIKSY